MFEERGAKATKQGEFWVARDHLPTEAVGTFYRKLGETLQTIGFAGAVREVCRPAYSNSGAGARPGIDPAVFFRMFMTGFFGNLPSERAIASCSLLMRNLFGFGTPKQWAAKACSGS